MGLERVCSLWSGMSVKNIALAGVTQVGQCVLSHCHDVFEAS
jgi:hypothetical protein